MELDLSSLIQEANSRIEPFRYKTPLEYSHRLSKSLGCNVYLKLENYQVTGSFKSRGALNKILKNSKSGIRSHIVTASTGNHAAAVGYALQQVGMNGTIFLPENVSSSKIKFLEQYSNIELKYHANDSVETEREARRWATENKGVFVSPYNDIDIISGQGTIGLEILQQLKSEPDAVFVPVGGGGLISGIASYIKHNSQASIVGCQPVNSAVMHKSILAGEILDLPSLPTISDGTAGGVEKSSITYPFCEQLVDLWVEASEDEILNALKEIITGHQMMIEGSAGLALAGLKKLKESFTGKTVVLILCGNKISGQLLLQVLNH